MPPIPSDVREALGLGEAEVRWVRLRSSLGSIVGETFLLASDEGARVAMRSSALADLEELVLDAPARYEESEHDAAVVVVRAREEAHITVGYLERDEVRAFFASLEKAREARSAALEAPATTSRSDPEATSSDAADAAREALLATLHAANETRLTSERARLLSVLRRRPRGLVAPRDDAMATLLRADQVIAEITNSTTRLDQRIGKLRKQRKQFEDADDVERFDLAIERTRRALATKKAAVKAGRKQANASMSWGWFLVIGLFALFAAWMMSR